MKLLKTLSVLVAAAGLGILVAAAPSVYGHASGPGETGQADRTERQRSRRDLTFLAGRGAEIGVSVRDVDASDKARGGVVIEEVRPDSPADHAGLKTSDVVVEFDGEPLSIGLNAQYVLDFLEEAESETVRLELRDENTQCLCQPEGGIEGASRYMYVVMPMRL